MVFGFTSRLMNSLSSCHRFSMGFKSGDSAGVRHQLIPFSTNHSLAATEVFRIIVCHHSMTIRKPRLYKGFEGVLQYLNVEIAIHCTLKDTHSCSPPLADTSPDMYLHRVFWLRLRSGWLACLPTAEPLVFTTAQSIRPCIYNHQTHRPGWQLPTGTS